MRLADIFLIVFGHDREIAQGGNIYQALVHTQYFCFVDKYGNMFQNYKVFAFMHTNIANLWMQ